MSKILVIEDDNALRNDIAEILRFEGYVVEAAPNGLVGVEKALTYQPDLIICDIMMPELNGYDVLEQLRQNKNTMTTPFIFLTAKTDYHDMRQGMGLGADDYLTKPIVANDLINAVHARLNRDKALQEIVNEQVNELSRNIITALPHELRTPLNTIIGFSDMLMTEAYRLKPDQVTEWASHINHAAQRLYRLVENHLLYVKAEILSHNPDELAALKKHILDHPVMTLQFQIVNRAQLHQREADIEFNLCEEVAIRITDYDFSKIVEEIIDNAIKFSKPGTAIKVTSFYDQDYFTFTVTDHGCGMSQKQINAIGAYMQFERWLYEQQGSGLGLAIVKRFVELYDGSIIITSVPQKETSVTIRIPRCG